MGRAEQVEEAGSCRGKTAIGSVDTSPGTVADALRAWTRDLRDGFATSSVAYLLREKAWSPSAWSTKRPRRRREPVIGAHRPVSLHLR